MTCEGATNTDSVAQKLAWCTLRLKGGHRNASRSQDQIACLAEMEPEVLLNSASSTMTPRRFPGQRDDSLHSISSMPMVSPDLTTPRTATLQRVRTHNRNSKSGATSPKLLCDMGPIELTPTHFPSPRGNKQQRHLGEFDCPLGYRSKSKVIVDHDISRIRQEHPLSSLKEDEEAAE